MNQFDVIAVIVVVVSAVIGWRAGVVVTLLSLVGFVAGLIVAIVVLPRLALRLPAGDVVARNVILTGGFVMLPMIGSAAARAIVGSVALGRGPSNVSRTLGAVAGIVAVVTIAWIVVPVSSSSAVLASWITGSRTASIVAKLPTPPIDVGQLIASDAFPTVLSDVLGVADSAASPPDLPPIPVALLETARSASVQIFVKGCGVSRSGSGFVVAPGLVVTNAHVVAGGNQGADIASSQGTVHGSVVAYDVSRDLALLAVAKLNEPFLAISPAAAVAGQVLVTLGHPNAQKKLDVSPALTLENKFLPLVDIYGQTTNRLTTVLASDAIKPGSSGSAVINQSGEVVAVVYGTTLDRSDRALAVSRDELVAVVAEPHTATVSAGTCPSNL